MTPSQSAFYPCEGILCKFPFTSVIKKYSTKTRLANSTTAYRFPEAVKSRILIRNPMYMKIKSHLPWAKWHKSYTLNAYSNSMWMNIAVESFFAAVLLCYRKHCIKWISTGLFPSLRCQYIKHDDERGGLHELNFFRCESVICWVFEPVRHQVIQNYNFDRVAINRSKLIILIAPHIQYTTTHALEIAAITALHILGVQSINKHTNYAQDKQGRQKPSAECKKRINANCVWHEFRSEYCAVSVHYYVTPSSHGPLILSLCVDIT